MLVWLIFAAGVSLPIVPFLFLIPGLLLVAGLPLLPMVFPDASRRLARLCGWRLHLDRQGMFARAALAARWRIPEAELRPLLGDDLAEVAPLLGKYDACEHCRTLADYHGAAALRAVRRQATLLAVGWYLIAGVLVLVAQLGMAGAYLDFFDVLAQ